MKYQNVYAYSTQNLDFCQNTFSWKQETAVKSELNWSRQKKWPHSFQYELIHTELAYSLLFKKYSLIVHQ